MPKDPMLKDHFYLTVGTRIRSVRVDRKLTLRDVADAAKLSYNTVLHAEDGSSLSLLVLAQIAEALDCTLDDLVPLEALE